MKKTFYVSTPIYYPSGSMHLGNAFPTVLADVLARHHRQRGEDVFFLTGTDEHGEKIATLADAGGVSPQEYVDRTVAAAQAVWSKLNISYDDFIRTTQERHIKVVQEVFARLQAQGDIYLGEYSGHYCRPCESFWTATQLVDGCCPDCRREVYEAKESSYFFKVSKYVDQLLELYDDPSFIEPDKIKKEIVSNFIEPGLSDLCISRTTFTWGVPVPGDSQHVVYVWFDALINYISALGYPDGANYQKFWRDGDRIVHLAGKEISRFHIIYWPIVLLALGLRQPSLILAHSWIVNRDGKMGKSKGNAFDPLTLIERYGADSVRFYLASRDAREDNPFSARLFLQLLNDTLVNDLGNLLRRTVSMVVKYRDGLVAAPGDCSEHLEIRSNSIKEIIRHYDEVWVSRAVAEVFELIGRANKWIEEERPWVLVKEDGAALDTLLYRLLDVLRIAAVALSPILVELSPKIAAQIGMREDQLGSLADLDDYLSLVGRHVVLGEPLMMRIDVEVEAGELDA